VGQDHDPAFTGKGVCRTPACAEACWARRPLPLRSRLREGSMVRGLMGLPLRWATPAPALPGKRSAHGSKEKKHLQATWFVRWNMSLASTLLALRRAARFTHTGTPFYRAPARAHGEKNLPGLPSHSLCHGYHFHPIPHWEHCAHSSYLPCITPLVPITTIHAGQDSANIHMHFTLPSCPLHTPFTSCTQHLHIYTALPLYAHYAPLRTRASTTPTRCARCAAPRACRLSPPRFAAPAPRYTARML